MLAIVAGCGLSTRGHWHGPVICNKRTGFCTSVMPHEKRFHVNALVALGRTIRGPSKELRGDTIAILWGGKDGASHMCSGGVGQNGGACTSYL